MSLVGSMLNTAMNASFRSSITNFASNVATRFGGASARFGSFGLSNFQTVAGIVQSAARDAIHKKTLANFKVDKKIDRPSVSSPNTFMKMLDDSGGYIRPNRYLVEFNAPKGLADFITAIKRTDGITGDSQRKEYDMTKIGLLCHSVTIPQKSFQTYEHKQLSVAYKVPHSLTFDPITFTFYCDGDMEVRRFFDAWMRLIIDDDNAALNFYDDFIADVKISILDIEGNIRYMIKLKEAFPITLSNIDLAYASNNNLLSMSVTLSYKKWNEIYEE